MSLGRNQGVCAQGIERGSGGSVIGGAEGGITEEAPGDNGQPSAEDKLQAPRTRH